jgi:hypothetical protein
MIQDFSAGVWLQIKADWVYHAPLDGSQPGLRHRCFRVFCIGRGDQKPQILIDNISGLHHPIAGQSLFRHRSLLHNGVKEVKTITVVFMMHQRSA